MPGGRAISLSMTITCNSANRFFFQAEGGIGDLTVTGVQTCALPIGGPDCSPPRPPAGCTGCGAGLGADAYSDRMDCLRSDFDGPLAAPLAAPRSLEGRAGRSEERRVGKEGRSRWSPYH